MRNNNKDSASLKWYEKASKKIFNSDGSTEILTKKKPTKVKKNLTINTFQTKNTEQNKVSLPTKKYNPEEHHYSGHTKVIEVQKLNSLFAQTSVPPEAVEIINHFDKVFASSHPLTSKQRTLLPQQIRELSHNLTDERGDRRRGYMNQITTLSAYIYYYEWWNLVRLTKLFANLPKDIFNLTDNNICLDIGSGPLTVPLALFLSRPELRTKKLTWYCMDLSSSSLSAGEELLLSIAAKLECEPWKIIRVKGELGTTIKEKANLVTCANVFNEVIDDSTMPPDFLAKKYCEKLLNYTSYATQQTKILIIEPGVPKAARFISLIRDSFIRKEFIPCSPCSHCNTCAMDGKRGGKWCNFAFSTDDAPVTLKKLSEKSGLPKERAVLSFILLSNDKPTNTEPNPHEPLTFRITSDPIRLPGDRTGYYACSDIGLLLVVTTKKMFSGELYKTKRPTSLEHIDKKSGAIVIDL